MLFIRHSIHNSIVSLSPNVHPVSPQNKSIAFRFTYMPYCRYSTKGPQNNIWTQGQRYPCVLIVINLCLYYSLIHCFRTSGHLATSTPNAVKMVLNTTRSKQSINVLFVLLSPNFRSILLCGYYWSSGHLIFAVSGNRKISVAKEFKSHSEHALKISKAISNFNLWEYL